jgi:hypothetical protein
VKLPAAVKVGCRTYTIRTDQAAARRLREDGDRGRTRAEAGEIVIDSSLADDMLRETLLHEVLHAAWDVTPLRLEPYEEHEEAVITAFAPLLLDALRQNPRLVAYLTE